MSMIENKNNPDRLLINDPEKSPKLHPVINLFHLKNYNFNQKDAQHEKDRSVPERMNRMRKIYQEKGMRKSVEGVLLVYQEGHPHVLLLQIGNNVKGFFKLPGGKCKEGEDEISCLKRKLLKRLTPDNLQNEVEWNIGECISTWYRPNFETIMYPYKPPHIKKPKEIKKIFIVPLPEHSYFSVPKNFNFVAVPLFELYDNSKRYGPIISSIPQVLSRFKFIYQKSEKKQQLN